MEFIVAAVFIVVLVIVAMYIGMQKKEIIEDDNMPVIHTSGIYSVIRKSPRDNIASAKPPLADVDALVASSDRDSTGAALTQADRDRMVAHYREGIEAGILAVEEGDRLGVQRFGIRAGDTCPACKAFKEARYFVSREDIYRHPEIIPPYYPGCACRLVSEHKQPLAPDARHFRPGSEVPLPPWKTLRKV